jgi:hypothetical protein
MPDANVNVIFHGLFLFVQRKRFMEVLIPNMGFDHAYRAGLFLTEETLAPLALDNPYLLDDVTGGDAQFDEKANIVFKNQDYDHDAGLDKVYARIVLPKPVEIISLRPTSDPFNAYVDASGLVNGRKTRGLQILRYQADFNKEVVLRPHGARLATHTIDGKEFLNLHIIAEDDAFVTEPEHSLYGYQQTLQLLPGLKGKIFITNITTNTSEIGDPQAADFPSKGFSVYETLDLVERAETLDQLAQHLRMMTPAIPPPGTATGDGTQDCNPLLTDID